MGTGSLLAFPGSMVGAFLGGYLYQRFGRLTLAYFGEVFGTGILAECSAIRWPHWLWGRKQPFLPM